MRRATAPPSPTAAEAYSDYFTAETHYLSLANRIVAALCAGGSLVLVTGDPPAEPHLLSQALRASARPCYAVIDLACRADLTPEQLSRARAVVAALLPSGEATPGSGTSEPAQLLFVYADVDQLSDQQIEQIFVAPEHGDQKNTAALLLAPSSFLNRLEEPSLQLLKERLAAQFRLQDVGQAGGGEVLRHQLTARHARNERERRGIPASVLRGLAASGVLLSIGLGTLMFVQYYHLVGQLSARSDASVTSLWEAAAARSTPSDTPAVEPVAIVAHLPPMAAPPQPARLPQETLPYDELDLKEDDAGPPPTSPAAASDLGQSAREQETTLPATALPSTQDVAREQKPSPAVGLTTTQSERLLEPTPAPAPELQQPALEPASRATSLQPAPSAAKQPLSLTEIAALVNRGDGFLSTGDITSARLFYERAADLGDGSAALRLGATFDPGFLSHVGNRGTDGDPVQATSWYRRARELGDAAAAERLKDLGQQRAAEQNSSP